MTPWILPLVVIIAASIARQWIAGIVIGLLALAAVLYLFRAPPSPAVLAEHEPDLFLSPAQGQIRELFCDKIRGFGRMIIAHRWNDSYYRIAPSRAVVLALSREGIVLDTAAGAITVEGTAGGQWPPVGTALSRGSLLGTVGSGAETTILFPLENVEVLKNRGERIDIGEPWARLRAIWA